MLAFFNFFSYVFNSKKFIDVNITTAHIFIIEMYDKDFTNLDCLLL